MNLYSFDRSPLIEQLFSALFAFFIGINPAHAESMDPGGGIGGTGITGFGVVQKFGSIFVNGREFILDSNTRITRDGVSMDEKFLHLGDVVNVQGRIDANSGRSVALRVDSETSLQGAVDRADAASGTLTVLGQVVYVSPATVTDGPEPASWVAGIRPGERISVSGLPRSDNSWTATRLTRLPVNESRFVLHGIVERAAPERGLIRVSGQDLIVPSGRFPSHLANGDMVRVDGRYENAVRHVEYVGIVQPQLGLAGQMVEMSGYVQAQPGSGRLVSNHVMLTYTDATAFVAGTATDVHKDIPVVIRGEMQADGGVAVHEIRVNVEPIRATLPDIDIRPSHESQGERGALERPGREKPDVEKPGTERNEVHRHEKPEVERPEITRPEIQRPEIERPSIELPRIEKPEIEH